MNQIAREEIHQTNDSEEEIQNTSKCLPIVLTVVDTQYSIVKYVGNVLMNWKLCFDPDFADWDLWWTDTGVQPEFLTKMKYHQKINHFPGMYSLARKNWLAKGLMKMRKRFPEEYNFFPKTWLLPSELNEFKTYQQKKKHTIFIVKPEASCQGRGIFLTRSTDWISKSERYVIQKYLTKPFLIDGLKFDFRIYALIAGCDPLRIYLYTEGLVRFATEKYDPPTSSNLQNAFMHLTNYAINKDNENFVYNEDEENMNVGHKRALSQVFEMLKGQGHDIDTLWMQMKEIIIKTLCNAQPILKHQYSTCQPNNYANNMCFEILGFDIILNHKFKPYLLEVNHSPSFTTDSPIDVYVKQNLIQDTLSLLNITPESKMEIIQQVKHDMQKRIMTGKNFRLTQEEKRIKIQEAQRLRDEYENANLGGFEKIYPLEDEIDEFQEFINYATQLQEEQTGTYIRRNYVKKIEIAPDPKSLNRNDDIQKIYSNIGKSGPKQNNQVLKQMSSHRSQNQKKEQQSFEQVNEEEPKQQQSVKLNSVKKESFGSMPKKPLNPSSGKVVSSKVQFSPTKHFETIYKEMLQQQINQQNKQIQELVKKKVRDSTKQQQQLQMFQKKEQYNSLFSNMRKIQEKNFSESRNTRNETDIAPFYFQQQNQNLPMSQSYINTINELKKKEVNNSYNESFTKGKSYNASFEGKPEKSFTDLKLVQVQSSLKARYALQQ